MFPQFLHTELLLESRIKSEVAPGIKLDADAQICRAFNSAAGCPRGASCPLRHTTPSALNYQPQVVASTLQGRTVCKHWLRGLCKKGADCEYLHEYNLRKMPECYFFTKHGFCSSGDECMYLHITQKQRRPECRSYTAGFCRAGERLLRSQKKQVRETRADDADSSLLDPLRHIQAQTARTSTSSASRAHSTSLASAQTGKSAS